MYLPEGVVVLAESDAEYDVDEGDSFDVHEALPRNPARWGSGLDYSSLLAAPFVPRGEYVWDAVVAGSTAGGGCCITWDVGDLRPGSTETSDERFVVHAASKSTEMLVRWKVTARGVDHVLEGELIIPCAQEDGQIIGWAQLHADEQER